MLKQILIYLILSLLIVIFAHYAQLFLVNIDTLFAYINVQLAPYFNSSGWGPVFRKVSVLVLLPIVTTSVIALLYRLIKKENMPHFIAFTWVVWIIVVLSDVLIH